MAAADEDDWRLSGQEGYLAGAALRWKSWSPRSQEWDHDHCVFCQAKFAQLGVPDELHAGFTTTDDYHWICETCFGDFKERFQWTLATGDPPDKA